MVESGQNIQTKGGEIMAGQKIIRTITEQGLPLAVIQENGNVQLDDEWVLFRLTDGGLSWYKKGAEFAANIMTLRLGKKLESAVVEIFRGKTEQEAREELSKLSPEEQERTLLRSVPPKK